MSLSEFEWKLIDKYGLTYDPKEGLFILSDGSFLDGSGKCYAPEYRKTVDKDGYTFYVLKSGKYYRDYLRGRRTLAHSEVLHNDLMVAFREGILRYYLGEDNVYVAVGRETGISWEQGMTLKSVMEVYMKAYIVYDFYSEGEYVGGNETDRIEKFLADVVKLQAGEIKRGI